MVPDTPNQHLSQEKHPQLELFICDVADAVLKDVMPQMEHPFYSLSKTPVKAERKYVNGDHWLKITPSIHGLATIYDKDILIYAVSQLMASRNRGEPLSPRVRINPREFLMFTNRGTGGKDYDSFVKALERLVGTTISTNIKTGDEEQVDVFALIRSGSVRRKNGLNGRLQWVEVVLSDWVFNAIEAEEVLTMNRDYFRLSKPYERRAYEIARKHCGRKVEWMISLELLHKKMGATSPMKKFRFFIKELAKNDHLPDYQVFFEENDKVVFRNRKSWWKEEEVLGKTRPVLNLDTFERAKKFIPRDYSVYAWELEWVFWWQETGRPKLKNPDSAFIGFCKQRAIRLKEGNR